MPELSEMKSLALRGLTAMGFVTLTGCGNSVNYPIVVDGPNYSVSRLDTHTLKLETKFFWGGDARRNGVNTALFDVNEACSLVGISTEEDLLGTQTYFVKTDL